MRRQFFFPLAFLFGLCITNAQAPATGSNMVQQGDKEERNKRVALASVEALKRGDVDAALKDADSCIVNYGNGSIVPVKGIEKGKASLLMMKTVLPIDSYEIYQVLADGDWLFIWGRWSGTWKGDWMGQKATGKSFTERDCEIFKFNEAGKIIEHHSVQSLWEIATQVGLKLPDEKQVP
jgi:predicted ester cyclase